MNLQNFFRSICLITYGSIAVVSKTNEYDKKIEIKNHPKMQQFKSSYEQNISFLEFFKPSALLNNHHIAQKKLSIFRKFHRFKKRRSEPARSIQI